MAWTRVEVLRPRRCAAGPPQLDWSCFTRGFSSHSVAMRLPISAAFLLCLVTGSALADGPSDNLPDKVRRIPPPGIKIAEADRSELEAGAAELGKELESLRGRLKGGWLNLLPDVEIYHKAV